MNHTQLTLLTDCAVARHFNANQTILREGEFANGFYLVETGKVALESEAGFGESIPIQIVGAGDLLGWSWMFPPYVWQFTARAIEPTTALFFYAAILREYCEKDHSLGYELLKRISAVMVTRLQAAHDQMLSLYSKCALREPPMVRRRSRLSQANIRIPTDNDLPSNRIDAIFPSWDDRCIIGVMVEAEVVHSDSNKQLIDTLRRSKLFRRYEQVFSEATGLPLTLRPVDYWQLEHDGKKHQNRFCAMLAERPATLAVCLQAHQDIIDHTGLIPHTVTCPFGLTETAVPVKLGAKIIGYLRIGSVLRHTPAEIGHLEGQPRTGAAWSAIHGPDSQSMGENSAHSTRQIQCHRATAHIFRRTTLRTG